MCINFTMKQNNSNFRSSVWFLALLMTVSVGASAQEKIQAQVDSFHAGISADSIQLVDVRTPEEFNSAHIEHAVLADWRNQEAFRKIVGRLDRTKPVYVYCRSGNRSNQAADWLLANGFTKVTNLEGGIIAWQEADLPVVRGLTPENK